MGARKLDKYEFIKPLFIECKRVNIEFIFSKAILECLLHKANMAQKQLDKINGFNSNIISTNDISDKKAISPSPENESSYTEARLLFQTLLKLNQSIGKTCTELEQAALKYDMVKKIPPRSYGNGREI